jgi:hypothetical protein
MGNLPPHIQKKMLAIKDRAEAGATLADLGGDVFDALKSLVEWWASRDKLAHSNGDENQQGDAVGNKGRSN